MEESGFKSRQPRLGAILTYTTGLSISYCDGLDGVLC